MDKPVLTFRVSQGNHDVRRETVRQDIVKIGSDPRSHLRLEDGAARMHAVLEVESRDDVMLIDLGNEPGTLVNGKRVNKCHVRAGDTIQIGGSTLQLESIDVKAPSVAPAFAPIAPLFASNPFLSPRPPSNPSFAVAQDEGVKDGEYAMLKSGPAVHAEEVESHVSAIEVLVKWGTNVLHVEHLSPPRSFYVGERDAKGEGCDFLLPSDVLGAARVPVVVERAGAAYLAVPPGATGTIASASGTRDVAELAGTEVELHGGAKATMKLEGSEISFEVSAVNAGKKLPVGFLAGLESSAYKQIGMSLFAHLGIVASLAFFMPRMNADEADGIDRDRMAYMLHMLNQDAPKDFDQPEDTAAAADKSTGGDGKRAEGAEGMLGKDTSKDTNKRYSIAGPQDTSDPKLARERALQEAADFGMIGLLAQMNNGRNVPVAAWGETSPVGADQKDFLGNMWGPEAGDAWGVGGLGLTGVGEGGGGKWNGIGVGDVGTVGHGTGCIAAPGKPCGIGIGPGGEGFGHGRLPREHVSKVDPVRFGKPEIGGHLPPEVIQRIVRQNFGRFRNCYESSLRTNPSLQGRVSVKFVIGRDGGVSMASDAGSDLPDQGVVQCVARSFTNLSFPSPDGGIVTVVYPLVFSPSD